jgi:uncharacterized protein DUF3108
MRIGSWVLLGAVSASHAAPPAKVEIEYNVTRNGSLMAQIVEHLEHGNGSYQLTETWKGKGIFALLGKAKRVSQGEVVAGRLQPLQFFDERSGRDTARAWFDWKAKTYTMRYKGATRTEPMPAEPHDALSALLGLCFSPPRPGPLTVNVINGRGMSTYVYEALGQERVSVPAGEFDALKVRRSKDNGRVEIWLAIAHGHLPVRVLAEEDGTRYDQFATRISIPRAEAPNASVRRRRRRMRAPRPSAALRGSAPSSRTAPESSGSP